MTGWRPYEEIHGKSHSVVGRVVVWPKLESAELGGTRDIAVYLPPSLAATWVDGDKSATDARRYPVLYFNDGQNVFDEKTAYVGEDWQVDETMEALAKEGIEAIIVAVPNARMERMDEYNPWHSRLTWKELPSWATRREMGGKGDRYLDFVTQTIKPLVDEAFPTASDRATTGMVGSSMGGLISIYAFASRPATFGLAGVFSPSLGWNDFRILEVVKDSRADGGRVYVDIGGREARGMTAAARRLRDALVDVGYVEGRDLMYVEERYGIHRESAWARRLPDALRFLLAETKRPDRLPDSNPA